MNREIIKKYCKDKSSKFYRIVLGTSFVINDPKSVDIFRDDSILVHPLACSQLKSLRVIRLVSFSFAFYLCTCIYNHFLSCIACCCYSLPILGDWTEIFRGDSFIFILLVCPLFGDFQWAISKENIFLMMLRQHLKQNRLHWQFLFSLFLQI